MQKWSSKGAIAENNNGKVVEEADIIFLAMKPQMLSKAIDDINATVKSPSKTSNKLFVSILAGTTLDTLRNVSHALV